jgi:uncharacterized membrane protein
MQSGTGRLETFSDGVFAIAATLLILEISVPEELHGSLGDALFDLWPSYLAYVTSFLTIGIIWVNHHAIFELIGSVDRTLLFLNTFFLMIVAFFPFPTKLVAEFLNESDDARSAVIAYGCTLTIMALFYNALWLYASRRRRLIAPEAPQARVDETTRSFTPGSFLYAGATGLAFASPIASVLVTLAIAVFYIPATWLRRRREQQAG